MKKNNKHAIDKSEGMTVSFRATKEQIDKMRIVKNYLGLRSVSELLRMSLEVKLRETLKEMRE